MSRRAAEKQIAAIHRIPTVGDCRIRCFMSLSYCSMLWFIGLYSFSCFCYHSHITQNLSCTGHSIDTVLSVTDNASHITYQASHTTPLMSRIVPGTMHHRTWHIRRQVSHHVSVRIVPSDTTTRASYLDDIRCFARDARCVWQGG